MPMPKLDDEDFKIMAEAISIWFRYYEVDPDDATSDRLAAAALDLMNEGFCTVNDLATILIGSYIGLAWTRSNAPTSPSIH